MRREKAALLLLLTLLALSGWNISKANKLSTEIGEKLSTAEKAAKAQDFMFLKLMSGFLSTSSSPLCMVKMPRTDAFRARASFRVLRVSVPMPHRARFVWTNRSQS